MKNRTEPTLFPTPQPAVERGPCRWCGEPSVERVEVAPPIYTSLGGVRRIKQRATEADVCAVHAKMVQRSKDEAEALVEARKRAKKL